MADRKKTQTTRRKPQADPPQAETQVKVAGATTKEPFKIVGDLWACIKNADGEIIGEEPIGKVALYKAQWGDLEKQIAEAWESYEAAQAQALAQQG
jgi:hypothetical protein